MHKKWFLLIILWLSAFQGQTQMAVNKTTIPPFSILLTTGKRFGYQDIQKNKSTMLIYFAPDCDHCRDFTKKLTTRIKDFSASQIIMVSYVPLPQMQQFYKDLQLQKYPNVKVGTEENKFVVPNHFKIVTFPFTAVYNKSNTLTKIFREEPSLDEVSTLLKKN